MSKSNGRLGGRSLLFEKRKKKKKKKNEEEEKCDSSKNLVLIGEALREY